MREYNIRKITRIESYAGRVTHKRNTADYIDVSAIDRKFNKLPPDEQIHIMGEIIGYCKAGLSLIKHRGFSRGNEISKILEMISEEISERERK